MQTPGFRFWGREFPWECSATTVQSEKLIVLHSTKSLFISPSGGASNGLSHVKVLPWFCWVFSPLWPGSDL